MTDDINAIASAWGGTDVRLIAERENIVYSMRLPNGGRAALRLHRPGYQNKAAIEAELAWTVQLADKGFRCPRPIPALSGEFLVQGAARLASAVAWVDAEPLAELNRRNADVAPTFYRLGKLLAELHELSDAGAADLIKKRHSWNRDALTGQNPLWGRHWENPALDVDGYHQLIKARDIARDWLGQNTFETGAIHADAISENVLVRGEDLWLIDFDDSGIGYRLYDVGVPLVQFWESPNFAGFVSNIAQGYAERRGCDAKEIEPLIPKFTALRAMASAGWIISRTDAADPRHRMYVTRAITLASRYF